MDTLIILLQIAAALGILNVWLVRFRKPSPYRGGSANNMIQEFHAYGLPDGLVWVVGATKVATALALLAGIIYPALRVPSALAMVLLMTAALVMHIRIRDDFRKSVPAAAVLVVSCFIAVV